MITWVAHRVKDTHDKVAQPTTPHARAADARADYREALAVVKMYAAIEFFFETLTLGQLLSIQAGMVNLAGHEHERLLRLVPHSPGGAKGFVEVFGHGHVLGALTRHDESSLLAHNGTAGVALAGSRCCRSSKRRLCTRCDEGGCIER